MNANAWFGSHELLMRFECVVALEPKVAKAARHLHKESHCEQNSIDLKEETAHTHCDTAAHTSSKHSSSSGQDALLLEFLSTRCTYTTINASQRLQDLMVAELYRVWLVVKRQLDDFLILAVAQNASRVA